MVGLQSFFVVKAYSENMMARNKIEMVLALMGFTFWWERLPCDSNTNKNVLQKNVLQIEISPGMIRI